MKKIALAIVLAVLWGAVPSHATDFLVFTASSEHNVVFNNTPVLTQYQLRFLDAQGNIIGSPINLGKPTPATPVAPATIGDITVNLTALPAYSGIPRAMVTMVVDAIGPGGSSSSLPSVPFDHQTPPAASGQPSGQHR